MGKEIDKSVKIWRNWEKRNNYKIILHFNVCINLDDLKAWRNTAITLDKF
jgi:hypothetical protein